MNDNNIKGIAFITTLIFAIHPLNIESVAWISAVKVLNYSFFYLLATLTYLTFLKKEKIVYYILTMILFVLSFGGKEQAVTFPVWLLLIYFILGYDFKNRKNWIQIIPFFLIALFLGFITINATKTYGITEDIYYSLWQRFVFGCYSLTEYFSKFFIPYKLLYIYPFPMPAGEQMPEWLLIYPPLLFIFITLLIKQLLKRPYIYGILFFLIHIVITLHIIPLSRFAIVADRYIYLACIGLAFIVALFYLYIVNKYQKIRTLSNVILFCVFIYMGIYSNLRCREWINSNSIKKDFKEMIKTDKEPIKKETEN